MDERGVNAYLTEAVTTIEKIKDQTLAQNALYETIINILTKVHDEVSGKDFKCQVYQIQAILEQPILTSLNYLIIKKNLIIE